jgi:hypothetical protein
MIDQLCGVDVTTKCHSYKNSEQTEARFSTCCVTNLISELRHVGIRHWSEIHDLLNILIFTLRHKYQMSLLSSLSPSDTGKRRIQRSF